MPKVRVLPFRMILLNVVQLVEQPIKTKDVTLLKKNIKELGSIQQTTYFKIGFENQTDPVIIIIRSRGRAWFIATVLKTVEGKPSVGSNPTDSATL